MAENKTKFKCVCGKEFENPQSFNAHKSNCKEHFLHKYGNLDKFNEHKKNKGKRSGASRTKNVLKQKEINLQKWISEQHKCEKCGKVMTKFFGTGRFCSRKCACSVSHYKPEIHKPKNFKCPYCDKKYTTQNGLNVHLGHKHHDKMIERKVKLRDGSVVDITISELEKYRKEHNRCEICDRILTEDNSPNTINTLCIDHIHSNGKFRGLLCFVCNRNLGWFENNKDSVLKYLNEKGEEDR